MNMLWAVILLPAGLLILIKAADLLVDGAVSVAEKFHISPLLIGLTIVAMGTSAPEVAASITAAAHNFGDTAIGNVYGSNIANLALVGGICAIIRPIRIGRSIVRRELPALFVVSMLLWPVLFDLQLSRSDAVILLVIFAALMGFVVHAARKQIKTGTVNASQSDILAEVETHAKNKPVYLSVVLIVLGLVGLAGGADLTVRSAVFIGKAAGLSEAVIGLTIIAIGTSLPELTTCVVASVKGHDDLSIGNLIGSNIFNTLLVVSTAGLVRPFSINPRLTGTDYWVMVGVTGLFVAISGITRNIKRLSGIILTATYIAYMTYVFVFTRGV
ncbi:MAG TPA: calcium/sodium antiporter [Phycisphaerales bacterium]|nr:calcium/sodium antiporter [Phycisphaerales bacterium]